MRVLGLALLLASAACGTEEEPPDPCVNSPTWTQNLRPGVIERTCISCHTQDKTSLEARQFAPLDMNFDTFVLAQPKLAEIADSITSGRMPPMSADPLMQATEQERELAALWRRCGFKE